MAVQPDVPGAGQPGPRALGRRQPDGARRRGPSQRCRRPRRSRGRTGAGRCAVAAFGSDRRRVVPGAAARRGAASLAPPADRCRHRHGRSRRAARDRVAGRPGLPRTGRGRRAHARRAVAAAQGRAAVAGDRRAAVAGLERAPGLCRPAGGVGRPDGGSPARLCRTRRGPPQLDRQGPERRRPGHRPALRPRRADRLRAGRRGGDRAAVQLHRCREHAGPAADRAGLHHHRGQRFRPPDGAGRRRAPTPARGHDAVRAGHPKLPAGEHGVRRHRRLRRLDRAGDHRHPGRAPLGAAGVHHQLRAQHRLCPGAPAPGAARPAGRRLARVPRGGHRLFAAQLRGADADPAAVRG